MRHMGNFVDVISSKCAGTMDLTIGTIFINFAVNEISLVANFSFKMLKNGITV